MFNSEITCDKNTIDNNTSDSNTVAENLPNNISPEKFLKSNKFFHTFIYKIINMQ